MRAISIKIKVINKSILFQVLCIYEALDEIDVEKVAKYVSGLQQLDGSFFGDKWGEIDTRFSFCAVAILSLIVSTSITSSFAFLVWPGPARSRSKRREISNFH